jgi:hypothetical protein
MLGTESAEYTINTNNASVGMIYVVHELYRRLYVVPYKVNLTEQMPYVSMSEFPIATRISEECFK